jgi:hypothetical protein
MSKTATDIVQEYEELYSSDIEDDDYVFVLGPDGALKQVILPDDVPFKAPKNIAKILKIFNIHDIDDISGEETVH